jgi:hypothetical protein
MAIKGYEQGKVKVVWIETDPERIYSKMFENEKAADAFGKKKKNYVIFELVWQANMEEFEWKLKPFGQHKFYRWLLTSFMRHEGLIRRLVPGLIK